MSPNILEYSYLIPAVPFVSAIFLLLFGKRLKPIVAGVIGTVAMGSTFIMWIISFCALQNIEGEEVRRMTSQGYTWMQIGNFSVDFRFMVDPLSIVMVGFITLVATLIHVYSIGYMKGDPRFSRFFAYLNLFAASMLILVLGENLLVTFLGWEGVGLCSYLLISFWFEKKSAATAGKKAFVANRVGDVGFLLAMFLIIATPSLGSLSYTHIQDRVSAVPTISATAIVLLLFVGAMGKSAQFPLHIWLPDAMEGPTPVSALIHAATMVTAGVFLLVRISPLIGTASPEASSIIAIVGLITALYAAICALAQNDIKRVLAYSTISQLGFTFLAIGVGAYSGAIFHVVTHAFFKALLFLGSGSVIHAMHPVAHEKHFDEQDMRNMGGLKKHLPITHATFLVGWLAIAGIFPFAGFWSKDEILGATFLRGGILGYGLWVLGMFAALLTAFYMTRQVQMVFYSKPRFGETENLPHESPKTMTIPLIILSAFGALIGLINVPLKSREELTKFIDPAIHGSKHAEIATFVKINGLSLAGISLALAIIGILIGIKVYRSRPVDSDDEPLKALGPVVPLSLNAFYVNTGVANLVAGIGTKFANTLAFFVDNKVIDGASSNMAKGIEDSGRILRKIQSGFVRRYVLYMSGGTLLILLLALWGNAQ